MNILHTSDLHLGKMLENYSRISEQEFFFDELTTICDKEEIDILLIAGDVYDVKNPKAIAEKLFYKSLKRLSKDGERLIIIIAGNHDSHDRIMSLIPLVEDMGIIIVGYPGTVISEGKFDTYEVLESIEGAFKIKFKNEIVNLIALPYPSEQSLNVNFDADTELDLQKSFNNHIKELLLDKTKIYNDNEINLFMGHIFLRGGETTLSEQAISVGGSLQLTTDVLPNCDYIALGHLHRSQEINGENLAYYSGSPIAYSFSERSHKKSVNVCNINFENNIKNIDIKKVPLTSYIPLEIWTVSSTDEALEMCEKNKDSNAYIDLRIKTDEILTKTFFSEARALKNNIVFINTITSEQINNFEDLNAIFEEKSLLEEFIDYFKNTHNTEPEQELLDLFIKIGEYENE